MSAPAIAQNYSGIIIDQNATPRFAKEVEGETPYYQTFLLPESLERGFFPGEVTFPALTGFQLLIGTATQEPENVEFDWTFEQHLFGSGWTVMRKGTFKGAPFLSDRIWVDALFDETFEVQPSMVPSELREEAPTRFRIKVVPKNRVKQVWYVAPNPYSSGQMFEGNTALAASLNFRLLGLVADSGTDLFGNPYRETAIISQAGGAGADPNTGYWLSSPQPTKFAVVSHYSDLRPFPTTPKYGVTNLIENPNFEYDLLPVYNEEKLWVGGKPIRWEPIGGTTLRINRWRGQWQETEVYKMGEAVERTKIEEKGGEIIKEETITYVSIVPENRAIDPIKDEEEGESHWLKLEGQFEALRGIQYLEVNTGAVNRGVRLQKAVSQTFEGTIGSNLSVITEVTSFTGIELGLELADVGGVILPGTKINSFDTIAKTITLSRPATKEHAKESITASSNGGEIPVKIGVPVTLSFWIKRQAGYHTDAKLKVKLGSSTVGEEELKLENLPEEWTKFELTLVPTASGLATVSFTNTTGSPAFFLDSIMVNLGLTAHSYIDGDVVSCQWNGPKGRSTSVQLVEKESENNAVVVDAVLVDPITPGVGMNIYYSTDLRGSEHGNEPTIEEWEQKLWTRVPQTFVLSGKTTFVLPKPVTAKFMKVEFTNLQGKPYEPGEDQAPVSYKQFPDWVKEVFLALTESPNFVVSKVGVVFDRLELLFNYYKNDLTQAPTSPVLPMPSTGNAQDLVDPTTLAQIKQTINTFTQPTAARANQTLLGETQRAKALRETNAPVEGEPTFRGRNSFPVSSVDRSNIVIDQNTPVMFFYVTCRHEYKELTGKFAENQAYFAGLKQLAFIRHEYSATFDGELYIETGGDDVNTDRNDFVIEVGRSSTGSNENRWLTN